MANSSKKQNAQKLSAESWLDAALQVLAEQGLQAVAVEPLAKKLGVTKGSFYWHFKNRNALITSLLAFWEDIEVKYISEYKQSYEDPQVFLKEALNILIADETNRRVFLHLSNHLGDHEVKSAYEHAVIRRLDLFSEAYAQMGMSKKPAKEKALSTYCGYFGLIKLIVDGTEGVLTSALQTRLIKQEIEQALEI